MTLCAAATALLATVRSACEEFTPFIEAVYTQLADDPNAAVRKADKSFFSLADGVVQVRASPAPALSRARALERAGGR